MGNLRDSEQANLGVAAGRPVAESYVASKQLPLVGVTTIGDILLTEEPLVTGLLSPEGSRKEGKPV